MKASATRLAVAQDVADEVEGVALKRRGTGEAPAYHDVLGFLADDGCVFMGRERLERSILRTVYGFGRFPCAEIFLYNGNGAVGVQVAGHDDGHVVGHVVFTEVVFYVRY